MTKFETTTVRQGLGVSRFALMLALPLIVVACGSDSNNASTVPTGAPVLGNPDDQTYTVGDEDILLAFPNTGGRMLTGCTVAPALPAGLSVGPNMGNNTCAITGTPTAAAASAVYTVTATNATGMSAGTVTIVVEAAEEPDPVAPAAACPTVATATAPYAFDFSTGVTPERDGFLYLRGNISAWAAGDATTSANSVDYSAHRFTNTDTTEYVYHLVVSFNAAAAGDAVAPDDSGNIAAQFKIASDDSSWTTQLWVQGTDGNILTGAGTELALDTAHPIVYGSGADAGDGNNMFTMVDGTTYLFTLDLTEENPTERSADDATNPTAGTLTISACTPASSGS